MMGKKVLVAVLCLTFIAVVYFSASRPTAPLDQIVCDRLVEQYGDCEKIVLIDGNSNLVFADSEVGIISVLMDKDFTDIIKVVNPLYYQEYNEENKSLSWQASKLQKDLSLISGFASDDVKSIIINSEGDIQPNRFFIRDNLWFWYVTFPKDEVILPVDVTAFDVNGNMIFGGNEDE